MPKEQLVLREVKETAYDILVAFREFCKTHGLKYYLSNGTLLGAVKYGGFIPWDDDVDVLMPRQDYDKLVEIYKDSDKYQLFSRERNENYKFTFAKLCDVSTRKVETNIDNGVQLGVDIDIFPLDSCSSHILRPFVQKKIQIYQIGCVLSKFTTAKGYSLPKRVVIGCCRLLKFDFFYRRLTKIITKETKKGEEFSGCLMWPIYGKKEIVPSEVFCETIYVEFEDERFPAPIGYDTYLRSLYGAYEQDPPMEKQKSHHNYTAYRI